MAQIKIGINGFGRIGRCVFKQLLSDKRFTVVGINDLSDVGDLCYLLKYDSIHGWYPNKVSHTEDRIEVDEHAISFSSIRNPAELAWGAMGADIILECTGAFRDREKAALHLEAGAKKVIISAPSENADKMFVFGVNSGDYDPQRHHIISNSSCTTNSLAPVAAVLLEEFGIEHLLITTVHAYTSSQSLMDTPTRKRRRGRSAALSIVPTTTGAARATARILPELEGKIDGMALRVPVPDGSVTDIVARLGRDVTADAVNQALERAAGKSPLEGVLRITDEALVSRDIIGDRHSSVVDAESTMVVSGRAVKVLAWYDNEWGYAARMVDMAGLVGTRGW